jgi:hypothetical protein
LLWDASTSLNDELRAGELPNLSNHKRLLLTITACLALQDPSGLQAVLEVVQGPAAIKLPDCTDSAARNSATAASGAVTPTAAGAAGSAAAAEGGFASTPAAALLFLGQLLLKQGAVQQAEQLHRQAVQLEPTCGCCALGLAQVLECQWQYAGVLQVLLEFCDSNPDRQLGPLPLKVSFIMNDPAVPSCLRLVQNITAALCKPQWP